MVSKSEVFQVIKKVNPYVKENDSLITSGIYNSIEIVSLVVELEDVFAIRISPMDIDVEHFNTIEAITGLVNYYLNGYDHEETVSGLEDAVNLQFDLDLSNLNANTEKLVVESSELDFNMLSAGKSEVVMRSDDGTMQKPENSKTVLDFLVNAAAAVPNKVAVTDEFGSEMTFQELLDQSQSIGTYIHENYGCTNRPFVVLEKRDINSIVMFLGVLWSGNYYIAVDDNYDDEMIEAYLQICSPEGVLWEFDVKNDRIFDLVVDVNLFDDMIFTEANEEELQSIQAEVSGEDPMYGVFTSGTTGMPKCIMKSHKAMVEFIENYVSLFGFTQSDILGSKMSLMFDAITKDIFTTLYCGAKMILMPTGMVLPPQDAVLIEKEQITSVLFTPSLLRNFEKLHVLENFKMPTLKRVLFVGEALPAKYMNYWRKFRPDLCYVNLYGTSEMTGNCLYKVITSDVTEEVVPLDSVFPGYEVFLLDEEGREVTEEGMTGEICVGGAMLYQTQLSTYEAENKIVENPLKDKKSEVIYKTGDLVKIGKDNNLSFVSRKDFGFKHAGYRMTAGEIENMINQCDVVKETACFYDTMKSEIILAWTGDLAREQDLYDFANSKLPVHMLPGRYVHFEEFPLNVNGKIDKRKMFENL